MSGVIDLTLDDDDVADQSSTAQQTDTSLSDDEIELVEPSKEPKLVKQTGASATGDGDVEIMGTVGESVGDWPHAREHCIRHPFNRTVHSVSCSKCMCFICDASVSECPLWHHHCNALSTSAMWKRERELFQQKKKGGLHLSKPTVPVNKTVNNQTPAVANHVVQPSIPANLPTANASSVMVEFSYRSSMYNSVPKRIPIGLSLPQFWDRHIRGSYFMHQVLAIPSYENYMRAQVAQYEKPDDYVVVCGTILKKNVAYKEFKKSVEPFYKNSVLINNDTFFRMLSNLKGELKYIIPYQCVFQGEVPVMPVTTPRSKVEPGATVTLGELSFTADFSPLAITRTIVDCLTKSERSLSYNIHEHLSRFTGYSTKQAFYDSCIGASPEVKDLEPVAFFPHKRDEKISLWQLENVQPKRTFDMLQSLISKRFHQYMYMTCTLTEDLRLHFTVRLSFLSEEMSRPNPHLLFLALRLFGAHSREAEASILKDKFDEDPQDDESYLEADATNDDEGSSGESDSEDIEEEEDSEDMLTSGVVDVGSTTSSLAKAVERAVGLSLVYPDGLETSEHYSIGTNVKDIPLLETIEEREFAKENRNLLLELSLRMTELVTKTEENNMAPTPSLELSQMLKEVAHNGGRVAIKQPAGLTMTLRDYQLQDLQWMLDQEEGPGGVARYFWNKVNNLYVSHVLGIISKEPPAPTKGGILADEMGLGKTIVTLSLVLANPAPDASLNVIMKPSDLEVISEVNRNRAVWFGSGNDKTKALELDYKTYSAKFRTQRYRETSADPRVIVVILELFQVMKYTLPTTYDEFLDTISLVQGLQPGSERWKKLKCAQFFTDFANYLQQKKQADANFKATLARYPYKSVQSACNTVSKLRETVSVKGTLVICHVSLVSQWVAEAKKASGGSLKICSYYGTNRPQSVELLKEFDVVVTTYAVVVSDSNRGLAIQKSTPVELYQPPLKKVRWHRIVLDESHALRNTSTRHTKECNSLKSTYRWCMSGTPMAKSPEELYGQLKFVLGSNPVLKSSEASYKKAVMENGDYRYRLLKSMMIRHRKDQVFFGKRLIAELPALKTFNITVSFNATERAQYTQLHSKIKAEFMTYQSIYSVTKLMQLATPLRMSCSVGPSNNASRQVAGDNMKAARLSKSENSAASQPLNKDTGAKLSLMDTKFSKVAYLMTHLKDNLEKSPESKALVFTSFHLGISVMEKALREHKIPFVKLVGSTCQTTRKNALTKFNDDSKTKVFLMSIRAGGVGINITRANLVYILEPNMNSALEKQAIGRVHRMGQKRDVSVFRMIMKDSIEEKVLKFRDEVVKRSSKGSSKGSSKKRKASSAEGDGDIQVDESQRHRLIEYLKQFYS